MIAIVATALFFTATLPFAAMIALRIFASDAVCRPVIEAWAKQEGFSVEYDEDADPLFPDYGPFFVSALHGQKIYRLAVSRNGEKRIVYVRCGHWLLGLLRPKLTVRWKEPPQPASGPAAGCG
ncbi:MAG: hypothetical protein NTV51_28985 [Verrucomicrobia bacterium]|nr:hypothetical protein [Verrucomicrobiota bacterium]